MADVCCSALDGGGDSVLWKLIFFLRTCRPYPLLATGNLSLPASDNHLDSRLDFSSSKKPSKSSLRSVVSRTLDSCPCSKKSKQVLTSTRLFRADRIFLLRRNFLLRCAYGRLRRHRAIRTLHSPAEKGIDYGPCSKIKLK